MPNSFHDSTSFIDDSSALRHFLARDGYILLRGVIERELLFAAAKAITSVLADDGSAAFPSGGESILLREGPMAASFLQPNAGYAGPSVTDKRRYRAIYRLGALHLLPNSRSVRRVIESIYREPVLYLPAVLPRVVFPVKDGGSLVTSAHQDFPSVQGSERALTVWCAVCDIPMLRGGLVIARGRHREGVMPYGVSHRGDFELADDFGQDEVCGDVRAGDVLIFSCFAPHRSLPNHTSRVRVSVDFRFQPLADPVSEFQCSDFCQPARCDWSDIYEGSDIPSELRYFWRKLSLQVHRHDPQFDRALLRAAQVAAELGNPAARGFLERAAATPFVPVFRSSGPG